MLILLGGSLIRQQRIREAQVVFEEASSAEDPRVLPAAFCGAAWCGYQLGDVDDAVGRFAEARAAAQSVFDDVFSRYAEQNQAAIDDHHRKEEWIDLFDRDQIKNNWLITESYGPRVELVDGVVRMHGEQRRTEADQMTELKRDLDMPPFVSFEADLRMGPNSEGITGVRWIHERTRKGESEPFHVLAVGMDRTGAIYVYHREDFQKVPIEWQLVDDFTVEPEETHRFTIERPDYEEGLFKLRVNGREVLEVRDASYRNFKKVARGGVFVFAGGLKRVDVSVEYARIIRYATEP